MKNKPEWIRTKLNPDKEILQKSVTVKDATGREIRATLQVEDINSKGQVVVSANYNSSPIPNSAAFTKFYLSQQDIEEYERDGEKCVLAVHDPQSAIKLPK